MSKKLLCVLAILFVVFVYFHGLGSYGFVDPDEGRYSEIPREMIESGDFVTPRLNYVKYFEKPIMHYWLTAGAFMLLGQNEFAGRLTPAVLGLLGCAMTSWLAFRITRSKYASFLSGMILASSVLWFSLSRLNITDMTLTFFFTASLVFFRFWSEDTSKRIWLYLFYASMALAVMTKGLIGVVLPGGIAVIYSLLTKQAKKILTRIFSPLPIILFFVIACVWFVPICMTNPDFFDFFFIREHFLRYTTTIHERYQPFWFFVPILLAGFIPWTGLLWDSFRAMLGKCRLVSRNDGVFLGLWFFMTFIFFSFSNSKLVTYILPCFPPLAILAGSSLASLEGREFKRFVILSAIILVPLSLTGLIWPRFSSDHDVIAMTIPATMLAVMLLVFFASSVLLLKGRGYVPFVMSVIAIAAMFSASGAFIVEGKLLSHKEAAEVIRENVDGDYDVVVFQKLMQGMGYYLGRRTVTADNIDELEFGAAQDPERDRWFISFDETKALWESPKHVVITTRSKYSDYMHSVFGEPVREWTTSADVIFANF